MMIETRRVSETSVAHNERSESTIKEKDKRMYGSGRHNAPPPFCLGEDVQLSSSARARRLVTRSSHLLADTWELAVPDGAGLLLRRPAAYAPRLRADELATRSESVDATQHTTHHEADNDIAVTRHGDECTLGSDECRAI